jgi:hypothetical protein
MLYSNCILVDAFISDHVGELLREADHDRLVNMAIGRRQPVRRRIADWLVSIAEWVDEQPHGSFARA